MALGLVVTGLPASGKTTIARRIAAELGLPCLDKDDFLEALYETHEVGVWAERQALSRRSDVIFRKAAETGHAAVLVSHWRNPGLTSDSGTPVDWLDRVFDPIVEVCCICSPHVAQARFVARTRHPGHLDRSRDPADMLRKMQEWQRAYPIGFPTVFRVETEHGIDARDVIARLKRHLVNLDDIPGRWRDG